MAWDSLGARVRALEQQLLPSGVCVVVEGPSTTDGERRANAARIAEAERSGREQVIVSICLGRSSSSRYGSRASLHG